MVGVLQTWGSFRKLDVNGQCSDLKHKRGGGFQVAVLRLQIWVVAVAGLDSL